MPENDLPGRNAQPTDDEHTNELQKALEARRERNRKKFDPASTQQGKLWDAFNNPNDPVNEMPGGTYNTAGGRPKEITWRDAFDFSQTSGTRPPVYKTGCGRDALLVGIGTGGGIGGLHFILKG